MDPLAVLSLVGTIAQLVDFSCKLLSKSAELRSSSTDILHENADLEAVAAHFAVVVADLQQKRPPHPERLIAIYKSCIEVSSSLLDVLRKLSSNTGSAKFRTWKSIRLAVRSVLKEGELRSLQSRLAMLKSELTLELVAGLCQDVSSLQADMASGFNRIEATTEQFAITVSAQASRIEAASEAQQEILQDLLRDGAEHLSNEHQTTRQMMQQALESISAGILEALIDNATLVAAKLVEAVRQTPRSQLALSQVSSAYTIEENKVIASLSQIGEPELRNPRHRRNRVIRRSNQLLWFGRLILSVQEIYSGDHFTHVVSDWLIIPSPWLSNVAPTARIQRFRSVTRRESPKISLAPLLVVPNNDPVLKLIVSHDAMAAEKLLRDRKVHPKVVTEDGDTLLKVVAAKLTDIAAELYKWNSLQYDFTAADPGETPTSHILTLTAADPDESPALRLDLEDTEKMLRFIIQDPHQQWKEFIGLQRLYYYLISQDVDPSQRSFGEKPRTSAIEYLLTMVQTGVNKILPTEIYDLISTSLVKACDNPFHFHGGYQIGDILRRYVQHQPQIRDYHHHIERLLKGQEWFITSESRVSLTCSVALRVLFRLDTRISSPGFQDWIPLDHKIPDDGLTNLFGRRLRVIQHLTRIMEDNLVELLDDSVDHGEDLWVLVCNVDWAMRFSLIHASPMKGVHRVGKEVSLIRRCVLKELCVMMRLGRLGLDVVVLEDTILEWCDEWEVLDIWVEALRRCGLVVPQRTRMAWVKDKGRYSTADMRD